VLALEPDGQALTLRTARDGGGGTVLLSFNGVDTPEAARELTGRYLTVPTGQARRLGDGEWFVWQLEGLGIATGVDLAKMVETSVWMAGQLNVMNGAREVEAGDLAILLLGAVVDQLVAVRVDGVGAVDGPRLQVAGVLRLPLHAFEAWPEVLVQEPLVFVAVDLAAPEPAWPDCESSLRSESRDNWSRR